MKKKILLIGGGGHCLSCIDVIEQQGVYEIHGILDNQTTKDNLLGYPVLGTDELLSELRAQVSHALIAVGQLDLGEIRLNLYNKLIVHQYELPTIVSPYAYVSPHAAIGNSTIIMHHAIVNAGAKVGNNCIINNKALIEHGANVGNNCHIATAAIINGDSEIGDNSFIGSNAVVIQNKKIKQKSFIKARELVY